jgi:predicted  nucleic acid-binding Zn-ribbon protein
MLMNRSLVALDALQEVDSAIAQVERTFRALDTGASEKAALETAQAEHDAAADILRTLEREQLDAELELKAVEEKKRDHEGKLYSGKVRNPKELDAMQHEVEALGRQRSRLDEKILLLMGQVNEQKELVAERARVLGNARCAYTTKAETFEAEAHRLRVRMAKLKRLRAERVVDVPPPLLKRYEAIRAAKHGVGLARIQKGRCGACNTSLPRNTVIAVQETDAIITCESCGRILCIHPDNPAQA